jgi:hypothetical protein
MANISGNTINACCTESAVNAVVSQNVQKNAKIAIYFYRKSQKSKVMCPNGKHKWKHDQCMLYGICGECSGKYQS